MPRHLRPHVLAFHDFARFADDIADADDSPAAARIAHLDALGRALADGGGTGSEILPAQRLRQSLRQTGVSDRHAHDLLSAFRQDAGQNRYATMDDLLDYCDRSAAPVGRFLLELHGQDPADLTLADPLCNALQIINHLQDCQADYRRMNRVYLPTEWLHAAGADVTALDAPATSPALRAVLDRCLDTCTALLQQAEPFPARLDSRRLGAESAVIMALARRLVADLRAGDPLRHRITLSRPTAAWIALKAVIGFGARLITGHRA